MEILENKAQWSQAFKQGWLDHYHKTGEANWKLYQHPRNEEIPGAPGIDLKNSRLMLISSAGAYLKRGQSPFDAASTLGDYTIRTLSPKVDFHELAYAHDHYDHAMVNQDPQVVLPLRILEELVSEGRVGELAPSVISFTGYQPDSAQVVDDLVPQFVNLAQEEDVQGALLAPV